MNTLFQRIKSDQKEARLAGNTNKVLYLSVLIGEAGAIGKNNGNRDPFDDEVYKVITKLVKSIDETLRVLEGSDNAKARDRNIEERSLLMSYMPKQLTEIEIRTILVKQFISAPSMKEAMAFMKANYSGQFDAKVVKAILESTT